MDTQKRLIKSIQKELISIAKSEEKLKKKAYKQNSNPCKEKIEAKLPKGINSTLQKTFAKSFGLIFDKGIGIIEKTYNKEDLSADYDIYNFAVEKKGSRKELKKLKRLTQKSDLLNMSVTTVEGVGLGALGIGLPDIVIFIGMILKGIYEVGLRYGYDYDSLNEKYFILMMMKTSLSANENWELFNLEVDNLICNPYIVNEEVLKNEIEDTAKVFATDMMVLKFIQGLPIVGIIGGIFNPIYYNKILRYVRLKYYKRYLLTKDV